MVRLQDSKGFERGLHRWLYVLFAGLLVDAHDLRRLRRVQGLDLVGGLDALAADDQVILAAELAADFRDGGAHAAGILFVAEIIEGLGDEWSLMQGRSRPDGGFKRCHGGNPFEARR